MCMTFGTEEPLPGIYALVICTHISMHKGRVIHAGLGYQVLTLRDPIMHIIGQRVMHNRVLLLL